MPLIESHKQNRETATTSETILNYIRINERSTKARMIIKSNLKSGQVCLDKGEAMKQIYKFVGCSKQKEYTKWIYNLDEYDIVFGAPSIVLLQLNYYKGL